VKINKDIKIIAYMHVESLVPVVSKPSKKPTVLMKYPTKYHCINALVSSLTFKKFENRRDYAPKSII
jgi:hypothetical protein